MSGEHDENTDKFDTNGEVPRVQGPGGRVLKKSTSMYLNVVAPHKPGRPSIDYSAIADNQQFTLYGDENYIPSERVQDVLNKVHDPKHRAHKIFSEMDVLKLRSGNDFEWREVSRWVKYEEKIEEGGHRWSKPHVASLSMHYIVELRRLLMEGVLLLDIECYSISQIVEKFLDEWILAHALDTKLRTHLRTILLKHHRHLEEAKKEKKYKRSSSSQNMLKVASQASITSNPSAVSLDSMDSDHVEATNKQNERILRKIPKGSEVASIWIGAVEELEHPICGFMRLNDPRMLGDLSEVNLPTRFIFILLGPTNMIDNYTECGRCIATMMVDDIFREVAFKCRNKDDLIAGCDEFLEQVTVLPPGEWDPKIRIEPPSSVPDQQIRKTQSSADFFLDATGDDEIHSHADPDLVISCRPFKGLYCDIKRKIPFYGSDFKDAFHIQCLASFIYIFLATLTPNVTFGGMLGKATAQYLGVMECVFAAAVSGVAFALLSGQPMNILGSTGPMLVLEKIIFDICKDNDWEFLPFRCWVGIWTTGYLLLIVCFDLSALVKYITRFTEESFACLIALIFIYEAFVKVAEIHYEEAPLNINPDGDYVPPHHCECVFTNTNTTTSAGMTNMVSTVATTFAAAAGNVTTLATNSTMTSTEVTTTAMYWSKQMCENMLHKWHCTGTVPDAFVFSIILFIGTFGISIFCVSFKTWSCFPTFVRQMISDFGVLIAIVAMVGFDYGLGLATPKLTVPSEFRPTRSDVRGWLINPLGGENPWWLYIAAGLPAIIATILIFMDQQITAVIVNRKENKLKKGKGYHLDLLVVALLVLAHSFLGLPWYVAATVSAIAHIQSLTKESECTAPGERPTYLGVREQRVTALLVGILSGVAVLITNILGIIPMPVLYGVFLYMGYSALLGMQFIDRILLFLMPVKYQPDYIYLRHIQLWRVHMFTFIQILCLVALWVVKSIKSISIAFPLLVVFTGFVRKLMECFFTQYELKYLDDILPSREKKKSIEDNVDDNAIPIKIRKELANAAYLSDTNGGLNMVDEKKPAFYVGGTKAGSEGYTNSAFDTKM